MSDTAAFRGSIIIVPTHDEVVSLRETVLGLENACPPGDTARIVLALAPFATDACRNEAQRLTEAPLPIPVLIAQEKGGAFAREMQQYLREQTDVSHTLIWTADKDAPAESAALMIRKAKENPGAVVKLSRFLPGGSLPESKKGFINLRDSVFRSLVCKLYRSEQTDPHFGLTLFPMRDFVRFDLREKFMSFTIEYVLHFERLGTRFIELPLRQQARTEGKSTLSVFDKLRYFVPVFRLRFLPKRKLFRDGEV